jgi:ribose transport system substrate-binding protein
VIIIIVAVASVGIGWWVFRPADTGNIKIAFSGWTGVTIPYWVTYWEGMQDAAEYFGDVDLSFYDAETDPTKQLNHTSDMISAGIDAVAIVTVWPDTLSEGALLARDAGMGFISIDVEVSGETMYTGSDMVLGAYRVTKAMIEEMGGEGKVAHIAGTLADSVSFARWDGFVMATGEYENVEILDIKPGNYDRTTAFNQMEAWMASYEEIDGVFCSSDDMALGAYEALNGAGRENETIVCGYDAIEEYLEAIEDGNVYATVSGDPYILGWLGVYYGRIYALGEEEMPEKHMVHAPLVLPSNVTAYSTYVADQLDEDGLSWEEVQNQFEQATIVW